MQVVVVRDKADRGIKGVYSSEEVARQDIADVYCVLLDDDDVLSNDEVYDIFSQFEFLEFDVQG